MANKGKQSESAIQKIVVGAVLALSVGGSAPFWWEKLFPPKHAVMSELLWNTNYQGHAMPQSSEAARMTSAYKNYE